MDFWSNKKHKDLYCKPFSYGVTLLKRALLMVA